MGRLETRDLEILRTLARVHFASSAELNATFFSSDAAGHRRLRKLADLDLVKIGLALSISSFHSCGTQR